MAAGSGDRVFVHGAEHYAVSFQKLLQQGLVVEQRLDIVGLFHLAEVHAPEARAHEHAAPHDTGIDVEPAQVADFDPGVSCRWRARRPRAARPADRASGQSAQLLEDHVREDDPGDVELARADGGHLPVQDGDGPEVLVQDVADPRITPHQNGFGGGHVGGEVLPSQVRARSTNSERPIPGTQNSYQSFSQPKCRRNAVSPGGSASARKLNVLSALGSNAVSR